MLHVGSLSDAISWAWQTYDINTFKANPIRSILIPDLNNERRAILAIGPEETKKWKINCCGTHLKPNCSLHEGEISLWPTMYEVKLTVNGPQDGKVVSILVFSTVDLHCGNESNKWRRM